MEKDRSSQGSQHQFSIYSNKGGIIVKEEVSSEKAFTKAVKEVCIDESTQPLMERNMSLNFDHSVVDGVIALELASHPVLKTLTGPVESVKHVSGPIKMKKLGVDDDSAGVPPTMVDEVAVSQKNTETNLTFDTTAVNQVDSATVEDAIDGSMNSTDDSSKDRKSTDTNSNTKSEDPGEVISGTGTDIGIEIGTGEKPMSPTKDNTQNDAASPTKNWIGNNTSVSGHSGPITASVAYTPTSPIPNPDCISNRSDSTNTSNRSFAFPVLPREWTSSPVKMDSTKSRSRKSRGCSVFFCCN